MDTHEKVKELTPSSAEFHSRRPCRSCDLAGAAVVAVGQQMVVAGGELGGQGMNEGEENPDLAKDGGDKENTLVR
nr:hypothetical protein Iba_chr15dCG5260 [Ipomoea batatas]